MSKFKDFNQKIGRRKVLKGTAASAGLLLGGGVLTGFPTIWAQNIKNITLRQFGTGVSNINEIPKKSE
jgi:putative spermidine/putrescine transport system substrate-binding protein